MRGELHLALVDAVDVAPIVGMVGIGAVALRPSR